jgi:hypothetical protein
MAHLVELMAAKITTHAFLTKHVGSAEDEKEK